MRAKRQEPVWRRNSHTRGARTVSNAEHSTPDVSIPSLFALNPQKHSTTLQSCESTGSVHPVLILQAGIAAPGHATPRHFEFRILKSPNVHPGGFKHEPITSLLLEGGHRSLTLFQAQIWMSQASPLHPEHFPTTWRGVPGANKQMDKCIF